MYMNCTTLPTTCTRHVFTCPGIYTHFQLCNHAQWAYDHVTMAWAFNNNHIVYHSMDVQWSMGLKWTYFANPDYLVVQCWVYVMHLSPDTINPTGYLTYHYTKIF